jgi:hypothetical protein
VTLDATTGKVSTAAAGDATFGVAQTAATDGDSVTILMENAPGTRIMLASKAIAVGDALYGAAAGKVTDTDGGSATYEGVAVTAAAGDGDWLEVAKIDQQATAAA